MTNTSWYCIRTESRRLPSYDIRVEREVLETRGVRLECVDMDHPEAFDQASVLFEDRECFDRGNGD